MLMTMPGRSVLMLVMLVSPAAGRLHGPAKPNVLYIVVDDLRPELPSYGITAVHAPNLEALARRALSFDRAYCNQCVRLRPPPAPPSVIRCTLRPISRPFRRPM